METSTGRRTSPLLTAERPWDRGCGNAISIRTRPIRMESRWSSVGRASKPVPVALVKVCREKRQGEGTAGGGGGGGAAWPVEGQYLRPLEHFEPQLRKVAISDAVAREHDTTLPPAASCLRNHSPSGKADTSVGFTIHTNGALGYGARQCSRPPPSLRSRHLRR